MRPALELGSEIRRRLHIRKSRSKTRDQVAAQQSTYTTAPSVYSEGDIELHAQITELELLQQRHRHMQTELDGYKQRVRELEELCRDLQVTYLMNSLDNNNESRGRLESPCSRCDRRKRQKSADSRQ
ncbi:hypothetical protein ASPCAL10187 [Aspergillus calidoustus]|uniref:Uncharacterized protein n=1 Tax=Aspergillus calidoustus TaxID=454130 RepID=A0A0U5G7U4_ASPCI|nr:hypothetical protein ASPCAL10187 [Aspergillus calidoustus]